MANVTRRANKDGTTSYRVKVSAGLGADGRYVYRSATFPPRAADTGELLRSADGTGKHLKQQSKTPGKHHAYRAFFRSI